MSETLTYTPPGMPGMPGMPAMISSTAVQVATNGVMQFRFDPAFPNSTAITSLDPAVAQATEEALEAALAKAKAVTAAFKALASE